MRLLIFKIFASLILGGLFAFLTTYPAHSFVYNCCDCKNVPKFGFPLPFKSGLWTEGQELTCRASLAQCRLRCEEAGKKNFFYVFSITVQNQYTISPLPLMIDFVVFSGISYVIVAISIFAYQKRHHIKFHTPDSERLGHSRRQMHTPTHIPSQPPQPHMTTNTDIPYNPNIPVLNSDPKRTRSGENF